MEMKRYVTLCTAVIVLTIVGAARGNLTINGDFEDNTETLSQFNMGNSTFTTAVADATAFGTSEEIDLVTGAVWGIAPQSGEWKLGLHQKYSNPTNVDAFSLDLSAAVVSGKYYALQFFAVGHTDDPLGPVEIGLSDSATSFGTLIFSGTPAGTTEWTQFDYTFSAPVNASFLTVRNATVYDMYVFVDNFSLVETIPAPSALLLSCAGIGLTNWLRRRRML